MEEHGQSEGEKKAFVFRANLNRRSLSPDQKRDLDKARRKVSLYQYRDEVTVPYVSEPSITEAVNSMSGMRERMCA